MNRDLLIKLLQDVKAGTLPPEEAASHLQELSFSDLGFAKIDDHRAVRDLFPEVVFCQGKQPAQIVKIMQHLAIRHERLLATRASQEVFQAVHREIPDVGYDPLSRVIYRRPTEFRYEERVAVVSAGTADMPVAEEAAICLETMGVPVARLYDVGVAGIHRLMHHVNEIREARVVIVVAGMEGALASVVGGLTHRPVIAVPTSVGYGASFNGLAALLAMLNSCAAGVGVVNIDNGYGAAALALAMIETIHG